jgi:hypothetical protein
LGDSVKCPDIVWGTRQLTHEKFRQKPVEAEYEYSSRFSLGATSSFDRQESLPGACRAFEQCARREIHRIQRFELLLEKLLMFCSTAVVLILPADVYLEVGSQMITDGLYTFDRWFALVGLEPCDGLSLGGVLEVGA